MGASWRLYRRYVGLSLRGQMQYRASFVLQTVSQFAITSAEFLMVWALFDRFGSLRGWQFAEVALIYGLANTSFGLAEAFGRGFDVFHRRVVSGDFDRLLLRPRSTVLQVAAEELQLMRLGRIAQGLLVLGWAVSSLNGPWTVARVALLLAALVGGACLFVGLFVAQATLAFWTVQSLEIVNTVTYGGVETAQYPLSVYRPGFRRFFTYVVPLATVSYLPALGLLERPDPLGSPPWLPWVAPLVGVAFLLLTLRLWRLGVRHYRSTGS